MITLYTWSTPNGRKVSIMLEECGLPYGVKTVDITRGEQAHPDFVAINPNSKIPAIVDTDGPDGAPITLFESGAILVYLAAKTDKFLPDGERGKYAALQWLMFQMGGVGPMFGQTHHFMRAAPEKIEYGIKRYHNETRRLYGVMDKHLANTPYLAAGEYSVADIATYPWVSRYEWHQVDLNQFPNVKRWFDAIAKRPAVVRGMNVPAPKV